MAVTPPYEIYPAMSHPTADPAVNVVAARFAGFAPPDPAHARILEIGCATGHHLLPLAMRWPEADCTGLDVSAEAIRRARELAVMAGLAHRVDFRATALEDFSAQEEGYDFIIAHGFISWVPDPVKQRLLEFCSRHLTTHGLAVISFNVEAGWENRRHVVRKAGALVSAGLAEDNIAALRAMKAVSGNREESGIIDDMLAKGAANLFFDDFGPINDPLRLDSFVTAASAAGLRWLGESRVSDNQPQGWTAEDETARASAQTTRSPLALHQWMDERTKRTFRSALLCRSDTPLRGTMHAADALGFALRPASAVSSPANPLTQRIHSALMRTWPSATTASDLLELLPELDSRDLAREICHGLVHNHWWGRCGPLVIPPTLPSRPTLDPLRLACARLRLPLVDAWHRPCVFPAHHHDVLERIDGSLSLGELKQAAKTISPKLDFDRWLSELHERGMLAELPA
jgi:SAM-dependent methyltransferase